jgi:lipooligosaccharide transport system ATP-binding protein
MDRIKNEIQQNDLVRHHAFGNMAAVRTAVNAGTEDMPDVLIKAEKLTKKFGDFTAVDNIDFGVMAGECFGFLGPNGAGKTTTISMIHCVLPLTSGRLFVAGLDVTRQEREIKCMIGVAPQDDNLDPDFTVFHNLLVYARYFDIGGADAKKRIEQLLEFIQLGEKSTQNIDQLSSGMKRRLILARALINEPRILILDEPTTGLDPQARHLIWDKIMSLKKQGVTIILTTHYMEEAAKLCDRTIIMDMGRIIEQGNPASLVRRHIGEFVLDVVHDAETADQLKNHFPDARLEIVNDRILVYSNQPRAFFNKMIEAIKPGNAVLRDANLEDMFLRLTDRKLRE